MDRRRSRRNLSKRTVDHALARLTAGVFVLAAWITSAQNESALIQPSQLPSQSKPVQGVVMPVPKEIFRSLDQFKTANWPEVQRAQIADWKPRGDQVQIAAILGAAVAEGFVAMEARDSKQVRKIGAAVLKLSRGLGVQPRALGRTRSIMDHAEKNEWAAAREEWDRVLTDLERGMVELKSEQLSQIVSLAGWLRGTEALCELVLQGYSPDCAELIRQRTLVETLEKQILAMTPKMQSNALIAAMLAGLQSIHATIEQDAGPLTEESVRKIRDVCATVVQQCSKPAEQGR